MAIQFTKMHGLGNDFVVIDATKASIPLNRDLIITMADRHLGIGFDQLLLLETSHEPQADFVYKIYNSDGGEVAQCGNGARCIGLFIKEHRLLASNDICLRTQHGYLKLQVQQNQQVSVDMGEPYFDPHKIPFHAAEPAASYQLELLGQSVEFGVVSIGNPHAIIQQTDPATLDFLEMGSLLSTHPQFPQGVNVSMMIIDAPDRIRLQVYERGAGATLACGSAACAAVALGRRNGWLQEQVTVQQLGGSLHIRWKGPGHSIYMVGPAKTVYHGEWLL